MSTDFEAVHEQFEPVITLTLPVPPLAPKLLLVGAIEKVQGVTTVAVMHCENSEVSVGSCLRCAYSWRRSHRHVRLGQRGGRGLRLLRAADCRIPQRELQIVVVVSGHASV